MGGLGTTGGTAETRGRDMRGKIFPLSKYNAVCGEIQWHYDNSNQHGTDMTRIFTTAKIPPRRLYCPLPHVSAVSPPPQ